MASNGSDLAPLLGTEKSSARMVSFGHDDARLEVVGKQRYGSSDNAGDEGEDDEPFVISSKMSSKNTAAQKYALLSMSPMEAFEQSLRGTTLVDDMSKSTRTQIGAAVLLLRDALLGTNDSEYDGGDTRTDDEFFNSYEHNDSLHKFSLFSRRLLGRRSFASIVKISIWSLVFLTFFEPPQWCSSLGPEKCCQLLSWRGVPAFVTDQDLDTTNVEYYPNFHAFLLTSFQAQMIEAFLLIPVIIHVVLEYGLGGMSIRRYMRRATRTEAICRVMRTVALFALISGNIIGVFVIHRLVTINQFWRMALYVCFSKEVVRELRTVFKLLPEVVYTFILFFIVLAFYAWIGTVAFYETDEGRLHFSNIVESMWTLWTCVTTANYPDVMMASYNYNRMVTVYFVSFMVIQYYGFMNVILAVVVNFYSGENDIYEEAHRRRTDEKLTRAFGVLDTNGDGVIGQDTIMQIFPLLNEDCPDIRFIKSDTAELLFAILDKDGSNQLSLEEFKAFGQVMLLQFDRAENYMSMLEWRYPKFYFSIPFQKVCTAVNSGSLDHWIDVLLVLNAIVVGIQSYPELIGKSSKEDPHISDGYIDTPWEFAETVFSVIYCIEMLLKVSVLGWRRYIDNRRNFFDATITVLTVGATLYVYYPNAFSDSRLIRYVVMARVLRLFRLVIAIKDFQVIGNTMLGILPSVKRIFLLLFSVMYTFAIIGVHLFGGLITRDPSNPISERLKNTDFADNDYWANNFNDVPSGLNVLFNLLVINNWPEQASGVIAATRSHWTRYFFLVFHICGVVIVSNLLVATLIDSFMDEWKKKHSDDVFESGETEAQFNANNEALFEASEVTGTKTTLSGKYVAKMLTNSAHTKEEQRQNLHKLFTKTSSDISDSLRHESSNVSK